MDIETFRQIADSRLVTILLHHRIEGSEGEEHLRIAVALGKPVLVWRLKGREHLPLPDAVRGYGRLEEGYGNEVELANAIDRYFPGEGRKGAIFRSY